MSTPGSTVNAKPSWRFGWADRDGAWGWNHATAAHLALIHEKLTNFESMTMNEIVGARKGSKAIPTEDLQPKARNRLVDLGRDDQTSVIELRLGDSERLFGIRDGSVVYLLWWDPHHDVFP